MPDKNEKTCYTKTQKGQNQSMIFAIHSTEQEVSRILAGKSEENVENLAEHDCFYSHCLQSFCLNV